MVLHVDHIEPVSKGGTNDILNLITSCKDCNSGKSDKRLTDQTVLEKQREQLKELQERKEQIEMMFGWQKGLLQLRDDVQVRLSGYWSEVVPGYSLNENGLKGLRALQKKYSIEEIMDAMRTAADHYLEFADGKPTKESVELAWAKVGGICRVRKVGETDPHVQRLYYIRGILRNRLNYHDDRLAMELMREALEWNASIESLERHSKAARSWTQWRKGVEEFIAQQQAKRKAPPGERQADGSTLP